MLMWWKFGWALMAGFAGSAAAYESPTFTVVDTGEGFEVRDYAPYVVVETPMTGESRNGAFRRLFNYISGNNVSHSEMAMTTPVVQAEEAGETIAMTAPVSEAVQADGSIWMQFVLPLSMTIDDAPRPHEVSVRIRQIGAERLAALRYSGSSGQRRFEQKREELLAALATSDWRVVGTPRSAVYNGPFTPGFMRRNEVLVAVEK